MSHFFVFYNAAGCLPEAEPQSFDSINAAREYVRDEYMDAMEQLSDADAPDADTVAEAVNDIYRLAPFGGAVADPSPGSTYRWSIDFNDPHGLLDAPEGSEAAEPHRPTDPTLDEQERVGEERERADHDVAHMSASGDGRDEPCATCGHEAGHHLSLTGRCLTPDCSCGSFVRPDAGAAREDAADADEHTAQEEELGASIFQANWETARDWVRREHGFDLRSAELFANFALDGTDALNITDIYEQWMTAPGAAFITGSADRDVARKDEAGRHRYLMVVRMGMKKPKLKTLPKTKSCRDVMHESQERRVFEAVSRRIAAEDWALRVVGRPDANQVTIEVRTGIDLVPMLRQWFADGSRMVSAGEGLSDGTLLWWSEPEADRPTNSSSDLHQDDEIRSAVGVLGRDAIELPARSPRGELQMEASLKSAVIELLAHGASPGEVREMVKSVIDTFRRDEDNGMKVFH